ncbi:hypothetical protein KZX50_00600 [Bacillus infantis]|uniref:hypothetical protein n=1 Tax=Bacillus infantis TaxID=324767 RepID=UPI00200433F4|nr:hypothetical protein [Bacillus infantis]MCK6203947.1 hypothetical protein [Bacillus infantis]
MKYTQGEMFVIAGMADMVEKDGKTPHEVIERMREIERDIFFALGDMKKEGEQQ